jgi:hypothetical protein
MAELETVPESHEENKGISSKNLKENFAGGKIYDFFPFRPLNSCGHFTKWLLKNFEKWKMLNSLFP